MMIIYKYIMDNEINMGSYTTRKCWKLIEMVAILYE